MVGKKKVAPKPVENFELKRMAAIAILHSKYNHHVI